MKSGSSIKNALVIFLFFLNSALAAPENLLNTKISSDVQNIEVVKLASDNHNSQFLIFVKKSVRPHKHIFHNESVFVLSGSAIFTLGDKEMNIKKGDFIKIPKNTVHAVKVTSKSPLKVLSIQSPKFEGKDRVYQ